jgi:5,10-methylenetetrahydrofolate reductase
MVMSTERNLKVTVNAISSSQVHMEYCLHLQLRYKNLFHIEKHLQSLYTSHFRSISCNVDFKPRN